jgi:hypothetical protein
MGALSIGADAWGYIASFLPTYGYNGAHRLLQLCRNLVPTHLAVQLRQTTRHDLAEEVGCSGYLERKFSLTRHDDQWDDDNPVAVVDADVIARQLTEYYYAHKNPTSNPAYDAMQIDTMCIDAYKYSIDVRRRTVNMIGVYNVNLPLWLLSGRLEDYRFSYGPMNVVPHGRYQQPTTVSLYPLDSFHPDMSVLEWRSYSDLHHRMARLLGFHWITWSKIYVRPAAYADTWLVMTGPPTPQHPPQVWNASLLRRVIGPTALFDLPITQLPKFFVTEQLFHNQPCNFRNLCMQYRFDIKCERMEFWSPGSNAHVWPSSHFEQFAIRVLEDVYIDPNGGGRSTVFTINRLPSASVTADTVNSNRKSSKLTRYTGPKREYHPQRKDFAQRNKQRKHR